MLALPRAEQVLSVVRYLFTVCSVFVHRKRHLPLSLAMPTSQTRSSGRQSREVSSFLSWLWVSECCAAEMAFGGGEVWTFKYRLCEGGQLLKDVLWQFGYHQLQVQAVSHHCRCRHG